MATSNTETEITMNSEIATTAIDLAIYRYKFTKEFMDELYKFSKIHQYDDRKVFKDAWKSWVDDNKLLLDDEIKRLTVLNYEGDILDKMFKSARYYFRKKDAVRPEPKNRRQYMSVHRDLLESMDRHITNSLNDKTVAFKPSDGFDDFCRMNVELLREEITRLVVNYQINDVVLIKDKVKKTYKNRYSIVRELHNLRNK